MTHFKNKGIIKKKEATILIKEMVYEPNFKNTEVLARDSHEGYEYVVVSYGVHPCAYVAISEGQPYFDCIDYDDVRIPCHGGCTFVEWGLHGIIDKSYKVIGWDYGHYNDFSGIYLQDKFSPPWKDMKKWTTEEIVEECKEFIGHLYVLEHTELSYK